MRPMEPRKRIVACRIIGLTLLIAAVMPGGLAIWYYAKTRAFLRAAHTAQAVVIQINARPGGLDSAEYEFTDHKGMTHRKKTAANPRLELDRQGRRFTLFYSPIEPDEAVIDDAMAIWFVPAICGALAVMVLPMSVIVGWLLPWRIKRGADATLAGK